jgi:predicted PurR-regulated permease PerM
LAPVLAALILAYLLNPFILWAAGRWRLPRTATVLVIIVLMIGTVQGVLSLLGPIVTDQFHTLSEKAPKYLESLSRQASGFGVLFQQGSDLVSNVKEDPVGAMKPVVSGTGEAVGVIGSVIGKLSEILISVFMVPIYFFFFGIHYEGGVRHLNAYLPARRKDRILEILDKMDQAVKGFFWGRLLIAAISIILFTVAFALVGLPYWSLLGFLTGFLTIVPYVSIIGWPLAVIFKYLDVATSGQGVEWVAVVLWPSLAYLIPQIIEGWILTPWIQGRSTDIGAATVLIVLFIGGAVGGFFGVFFAIPFAACVKILLQELVLPRLSRWARQH